MKKQTVWILVILGIVALVAVYLYRKNQASKNAQTTLTQGTSVSSVLPDTATTSVPTADSTWNPAYRYVNQQSTANQAMTN